jgi:6-pyruvoyltetrahydropterin/6-carboxytetrahydropterin synthase
VDFLEVKNLIGGVVDGLDHQFHQRVSPFDEINPSAENIAKYFYDRISAGLTERSPGAQSAKSGSGKRTPASALYRP